MSNRTKYLKNLQFNFNSNDNIEFIIQQVFSEIRSLKQIKIYEDDHFNNVFDEVATKVFKVESNNFIELDELNEIVIDQLIQYIDYNIDDFHTEKISFKKPSAKELERLERLERLDRGDRGSRGDRGDQSEANLSLSESEQEFLLEDKPIQKKKKKLINLSNARTVVNGSNSTKTVNTRTIVNKKPEIRVVDEKPSNKKSIVLNSENLTELNLDLDDENTRFHLDNVKSISLKVIDIVNSDYLINKNNNFFIFKILLQPKPKVLYSQDFCVTVPEGNYTCNSLLNEIKLLMNLHIKCIIPDFEFDIKIDELTGKVVLYTKKIIKNLNPSSYQEKEIEGETEGDPEICEFELIKGPLLEEILGFTTQFSVNKSEFISDKPFNLMKRRAIPLKIHLNDTEPIIEYVIYLNETRTLLFTDIIKVYKKPISIETIYLDFDNYNFRDIPFFIKLQIRYYTN